MAYSESEVPEGVRDILSYMPADMRERVLTDYESRYAPFLAMLSGWKSAVEYHYSFGERSAISRLQEQFFPLGEWAFPVQGLAVPQRPVEKTVEVLFGARMVDTAQRPWTSCGPGLVQPTGLRDVAVFEGQPEYYVTIEIECPRAVVEPILQQGQLAFVGAPDRLLAALERASWWVQTADGTTRPARLSRYTGYMAFEKELATARLCQRHFDLWLPAFYPYGRKMIHLKGEPPRGEDFDCPVDLSWLGDPDFGMRFIGVLSAGDEEAAQALGSLGKSAFHLNAVPVVQTAVEQYPFNAPFPRVGNQYALRMAGQANLFGAVVYTDKGLTPASVERPPSNDPNAAERDVQVQFAQNEAKAALVKLYFNSSGTERLGLDEAPAMIEMTPVRFSVPLPVLGGAMVSSPENRDDWSRTAWYHSVLRPPLLSEGDLVEIIRQRQAPIGDLLRFAYASREILHEVQDMLVGANPWRSYLWPSLVSEEDHFDPSAGEIPAANYVPLMQCLRIAFERGPRAGLVPDFLLADLADYLASTLSQYFVVSCFRVDGRVV